MKLLTRRDALRSLGACSAAAVLGPLRLAALDHPAAGSSIHVLNVLFHGMFVIDFEDSGVVAYAPKVPNNAHEYVVGDLKQKFPLPGSIALTGPAKGSKPPHWKYLHPKKTGIFPKNSVNLKYVHSTVNLQFPDEVHLLRLTPKKGNVPFFKGLPAPYQEPLFLPEVVVFTYRNLKSTPALSQISWTPSAHGGYANLHFWAEPPGATPTDHPRQAFQAMADLMGYPNLSMHQHPYASIDAPAPDATPSVSGLTCEDELSLNELAHANGTCPGSVQRYTSAFNCLSLFMY